VNGPPRALHYRIAFGRLLVVWGEYINQQVISKEEKLDVGDASDVFRDATEDSEKAREFDGFSVILLYFQAVGVL
jgi:hypothetical protein